MRVHRICAARFSSSVRALATAAFLVIPSRAPTSRAGSPYAAPIRWPLVSDSTELVPGIPRDRMIAPASLFAALAKVHRGIPSFSRQTKLACSACHYQFPQLTPFGRLFKLNGYTLTGLETIGQPADTGSETLKLRSEERRVGNE